MDSDSRREHTVYVYLMNEGTDSWRPTNALSLDGELYQLLPTPNYSEEDEEWEFAPGAIVRCETKWLHAETSTPTPCLVAVEQVTRRD